MRAHVALASSALPSMGLRLEGPRSSSMVSSAGQDCVQYAGRPLSALHKAQPIPCPLASVDSFPSPGHGQEHESKAPWEQGESLTRRKGEGELVWGARLGLPLRSAVFLNPSRHHLCPRGARTSAAASWPCRAGSLTLSCSLAFASMLRHGRLLPAGSCTLVLPRNSPVQAAQGSSVSQFSLS